MPYRYNVITGELDLVIDGGGAAVLQIDTDSGTALPVAGVINLLGDHGINTTGAGNTATVLIDNTIFLGDLSAVATGSPSLTLTTGDLDIISGNIEMPNTSAAGADGVINLGTTRFVHNFGTSNAFFGSGSGNFTLTGTRATAVGLSSLASLTSGGSNTGIGFSSLNANTSGSFNTAVGTNSLLSNISGFFNTAIGHAALSSSLTGHNTAVGYLAGNGVTGQKTTAVGHNAQGGAAIGDSNTAIGYTCLRSNTSPANTGLGSDNLITLSGGLGNNVSIGFSCLITLGTGSWNTVLGTQAGQLLTLTDSDNILIRNTGTAGDNNKIIIGTQGTGNG